ncbi:hypothetical protein [Muricoccus vinaceus]|uniref:Uncharacterized protein n=1 Tax=Muricoccus vinaceus TaxID=424704 RepID=A0ABV6J187_9PROT
MSEKAAPLNGLARSSSPEVHKPGRADRIGPFGRVDLLPVADLTCAPDVEDVCLGPLNALPMKRVLPNGGSPGVAGVVDPHPAEAGAERPAVAAPYDRTATVNKPKPTTLSALRQWHAQKKGVFAAYSGDIQVAYIWRKENEPSGR